MNELIDNIVAYLEYLEKNLRLTISVHFSANRLHAFPEELFARILPYNVHKNPYCSLIKKDGWKKCIQTQERILDRKQKSDWFCHVCYAGVQEYIFPIGHEDSMEGYAAVSGYRGENPPAFCPDVNIWRTCMSDTPPLTALLEAAIPPLCRMFELLFTFPIQESSQGEFYQILQFLHMRHGQVSLDELCRQFGKSRSYISHLFSKRCALSLPAYCNDLKLRYAKTLLSRSSLSVTEISMDAGFHDVSYFILRFREKFGITPLQYRKQFL